MHDHAGRVDAQVATRRRRALCLEVLTPLVRERLETHGALDRGPATGDVAGQEERMVGHRDANAGALGVGAQLHPTPHALADLDDLARRLHDLALELLRCGGDPGERRQRMTLAELGAEDAGPIFQHPHGLGGRGVPVVLSAGVVSVVIALGRARSGAAGGEEGDESQESSDAIHGVEGSTRATRRPAIGGENSLARAHLGLVYAARPMSLGALRMGKISRSSSRGRPASTSRGLSSLGACLAVCCTAASVAHAQPRRVEHRAVVLRFQGPNASQARDAVVEALAPEVQLVTEDQAVRTAREIGVDVSTPEGMAQVVRHLGITLVVAGAVERRGRRAETTVTVLDPSGSELSRRTGPSPQRRPDRVSLGVAAIEAVQEAQALLARREEPPPPTPRVMVDPELVERPPGREPPRAASAWRPRHLTVLGGLRVRTVGTYVDVGQAEADFFAADPYPELDLELAVHPMAHEDSELRGLFFGMQGGFSVGIGYITASGEERAMTSFRFRFDVGFRHAVGGDVLELGGTLGLGVEGVDLERPDTFPSTLFTFLRPGLVARIRAAGELFMLEGGVGGRIGLDGGPLAGGYGPDLFFGGVDLMVGFTGIVAPGFTWAARLGYVHHALSFSGAGGTFARGLGGLDEAVEGRFLVGGAL